MEHVKNTLQNILTEWTPHIVECSTAGEKCESYLVRHSPKKCRSETMLLRSRACYGGCPCRPGCSCPRPQILLQTTPGSPLHCHNYAWKPEEEQMTWRDSWQLEHYFALQIVTDLMHLHPVQSCAKKFPPIWVWRHTLYPPACHSAIQQISEKSSSHSRNLGGFFTELCARDDWLWN